MGDADPIFRLMGNLDNAALTEIPDGAALRTLGWLEDGAEVHGIIANVQIALTTEKASTRLDSLNNSNYGVYCTKNKKNVFPRNFQNVIFIPSSPRYCKKTCIVYTRQHQSRTGGRGAVLQVALCDQRTNGQTNGQTEGPSDLYSIFFYKSHRV